MKKSIKNVLSVLFATLIAIMACSQNVKASESTADLSPAGAEAIYAEFLSTISFIENDQTWANMLDGYKYANVVSYMERMYAACVDNGNKSEEEMFAEYEALPSYDKFLWYATYLQIAMEVHDGHADQVANYDVIAENYSPVLNIMSQERNNHEEVLAAYEKLLHWQTDYIAANGCPYNFINDRSYFEEMGITEAPAQDNDEQYEQEVAELQQAISEELNEEEKVYIPPMDPVIEPEKKNSINPALIAVPVLLAIAAVLGIVISKVGKNKRYQ